MSTVDFGARIKVERTWANFVGIVGSKHLRIQLETVPNPNRHLIFAVDGPIVYVTTIYVDPVPPGTTDEAGAILTQVQNDANSADFVANFQSGVNRPVSNPPRMKVGSYFAGSALLGGSGAEQNLLSLYNPSASGVDLHVTSVNVGGVANDTAETIFLYRLRRVGAAPAGGALLIIAKAETVHPSPLAVVRSNPVVAPGPANLWVGSPGVVLSTLLNGTAGIVPTGPAFSHPSPDLILRPDEALVVTADANDVDWQHFVSIAWDEL